ncbi:unnamed protein product [Amoebophrya sp. A120]|nr:unnamed protein product [Amoebophrya sp. A120]|eukprot:GSA120T00012029001.1
MVDFFRGRNAKRILPDASGGSDQQPNSVAAPVVELSLQSRVLDLEEQLLDLQSHLEKRFQSVEEEVNKRLESKWEKFEIWDRRFKEHLRSEQEVNQSQMLNLKNSGLEYILQKGESEKKLVNNMELKVSAMDAQLGQLSMMMEKMMNGDLGTKSVTNPGGDFFPADLLPGGVVHQAVLDQQPTLQNGVFVGTSPSSPSKQPFGSNNQGGRGLSQSPPYSARSTTTTRMNNNGQLLSAKLVRAATAGNMLNYNVALEHVKKQLALEQEARQLLQEEMTTNVKALHADLQHFMQKQEHEYLKDQKVKLQEEHDARILKLSEGSVNHAFAQLKLELDVLTTQQRQKDKEIVQVNASLEDKLLQNLSLATEHQTRNSKDLWQCYIDMGKEWKEAVSNLQQIIENKSGVLLAEIDRKLVNQSDLTNSHFKDQKSVNDAFDQRLAKAELVVLQQDQKQETKDVQNEEEQKRWNREFTGLSTIVGHVKTKIAGLAKTQEGLESFCSKKIQDEVSKGCDSIRHLAMENFEKFEAQVEQTRLHTDAVDKLNKENRRTNTTDLQNMEAKMQHSVQELTATVTRLLQQAEFSHRSVLSQKLEEEKEYVVGEIKAMETNNIEFRMQTHTKMDSVESNLIDRIVGVDRKCYDALEGQKKHVLRFEKQTVETLQKTRQDLDGQVKKFEIRTESRLNEQSMQIARDISDVWKKLDTEVKYLEKLSEEMQNKIKDHENSVQANLTNARNYWEEKFKRELTTLTESLSEKLQTAIENERAERIQQEGERIHAMQKRFEAHESLNQRRHEELNQRMQQYCDTTDKRFQVFIKENEQLLTKKCDYLQDQIRDFRWDFDQEKIRQEEIRLKDQADLTQWKKQVEAKNFAVKYTYEKSMTNFLNMHFLEQSRDFELMKKDNQNTKERMQRGLDQEKMERIKMVGETRAILEESDVREHGNTRRTLEENRRSLTRELDDFREEQGLENQKLQNETLRVNSDLSRRIKTTDDNLSKNFDEKMLAEQVERTASLEAAIASLSDVYQTQGAFKDWLVEFEQVKQKIDDDLLEVEKEIDKMKDYEEELKQAQDNDRQATEQTFEEVKASIIPTDKAEKLFTKVNKIPANVAAVVESLSLDTKQSLEKMVAKQEAVQFLKREQDLLADGMTNRFLQGVLADTQALRQRVTVLESVGLGLDNDVPDLGNENAAGAAGPETKDEPAADDNDVEMQEEDPGPAADEADAEDNTGGDEDEE